MDIDVEGTGLDELTGAEIESISRSVKTISSTIAGTTPMSRGMGVSGLPADNSPLEQNRYTSEIIQQVEEYNGEVEVDRVEYENNRAKVVLEHVGS